MTGRVGATDDGSRAGPRDAWIELSQRADEPAVLNDLARRLASLRGPRDVLAEVAHQARRLLGVDVAYIMLLRDDRLRINVVDGSMGSVLRGIELERGSGLGGQVLSTGRPLWSERYLEDTRFPHRPGVDAAAVSEQLGGILGVPLIAGDETIGVLLAADRRVRNFSDRDVELLAALAAHAAVTIRNADLFERQRAAAAQLQAANDLRDALNTVVINGGTLEAVAAELQRVVGVDIEIRDADDTTVAGRPTVGDWVEVPVHLPSGYAGCLRASADPPPDDDALRLLRIGGTSVALGDGLGTIAGRGGASDRGEFVHALLSSDSDDASLRRRARAIGMDLTAVRTVAVLDPGPADPASVGQLATRLASEGRGWSASHAGRMIALLTGPTAGEIRSLMGRWADGRRPTATRHRRSGARRRRPGRRTLGLPKRPSGHHRAVDPRPERPMRRSRGVGIYRSVFDHSSRGELAAFIELTIGPLLIHDREQHRDLTTTLASYLEQAQRHAQTCSALHIHPNTLYQRLARITELLGPSWKDPGRTLEVQLALRLHRLLDVVGDPSL